MIMIDYVDIVPPKRFDLETYEDFIYVSNILDEYIDVKKTYVIETTLEQINKEFFKKITSDRNRRHHNRTFQ